MQNLYRLFTVGSGKLSVEWTIAEWKSKMSRVALAVRELSCVV